MAKEGVENLVGKGQEVAGRVQEGAMAAVDRVNDFVCNVSDSLNGSACANATMNGTEMANDTIGETIDEDGEDATGEDAAGEEAGDDGRRKLLDLTDAAGAVTDAAGTVSDAAGTVTDAVTGAVSGDGMMTDMNATDMNATMNGTMMNGTEMANDTIEGEAGDDSVAGDDAGAVDDDGGAGDDSGEGDDGRRKLSTIRKLFA